MKWLNVLQQHVQASIFTIQKKILIRLWRRLIEAKEYFTMSFNNLDQLYRQVIMDHYKKPRNKGSLDENSVNDRHEQPYLRRSYSS